MTQTIERPTPAEGSALPGHSGFNTRRMLTIARTELKQLIQAKDYWIPMVALGAIFFLVVPGILMLTITRIGDVHIVHQISKTLAILPQSAT